MASWNECMFDGWKSYLDDPCPYCDGPHFWQDCRYAPGESCVHHIHPTGSIIVLYVVVKIDIGVIAQLPLPLLC